MRLDKLLKELNIGSRSEVKKYLKAGRVTVDGQIIKNPDLQVDEASVKIVFDGKEYTYQKYRYFIMNKPKGVVTARSDKSEKTVMDILRESIKDAPEDLSPVGRLDKDTTGLLFITNNGMMAHNMLSPKKHVDKTYKVTVDIPLTKNMIENLEKGVDIGDDKPTLPATVTVIDDNNCLLTICEGRFHQVKRMMKQVGTNVVELHRLSFGKFELSDSLALGCVEEILLDEI